MLLCCHETFARLFYNISSYFFLLFIFIHFTLIFLAKAFIFFGSNPFYQSSNHEDVYEFDAFSSSENDEYYGPKNIHSVGNIINVDDKPAWTGEEDTNYYYNSEQICSSSSSGYSTPALEPSDDEAEIVATDTAESQANENVVRGTSYNYNNDTNGEYESRQEEAGFVVVAPPISSQGNNNNKNNNDNKKKLLLVEEEQFGDTLTIGSTSRSSINCSEDPFSSSSRRSCPKWESYTVFQKYDEEMLFLDRVSLQKLRETETLQRSLKASCPRSVTQRIAHHTTMMIKRRSSSSSSSSSSGPDPYRELEAAYVAQICWAWEALNWNRNYFLQAHLRRPGCPAAVAQQFQQFQVLLQRYVENEPYEHGPRPEIYARTRSIAPKLLQVPQFRDSDNYDDDAEQVLVENKSSRIPSTSFIRILEESIRTFMSFLKQDKKNKYQVLADLLRRSNTADHQYAALILLLKKINRKKKAKLNELGRSGGKCLRKRPKLKGEEELEILMAKIDLKLVSRVLRMTCLNGEQLHWCENKMSKLRISHAKLHRESSPIFFPPH